MATNVRRFESRPIVCRNLYVLLLMVRTTLTDLFPLVGVDVPHSSYPNMIKYDYKKNNTGHVSTA